MGLFKSREDKNYIPLKKDPLLYAITLRQKSRELRQSSEIELKLMSPSLGTAANFIEYMIENQKLMRR